MLGLLRMEIVKKKKMLFSVLLLASLLLKENVLRQISIISLNLFINKVSCKKATRNSSKKENFSKNETFNVLSNNYHLISHEMSLHSRF